MQTQFTPQCLKVTSPHPSVSYVLIERDNIGWKMDVIGHEHNEWPNGDTYQDTLDELMPFLAAYADQHSVWTELGSEKPVTFWEAVLSVTGTLD